MAEKSDSALELAIGLPLDVVAHKLMRIEADLRLLNIKALAFANDDNKRLTGPIQARVEAIFAVLDSIRSLASDIETDIQPRSAMDDIPSPPDVVYSEYASRKPKPDRDD